MISVKGGTKTWSTAEQQSSLRGDGKQTISSKEQEKLLGDQDVGTYLNKITDPNYVDPAKTRRVGNPDLDKDAFMKLFLAQLKNQDPTNPMQGHELAAQLAQFTSLEKLNNIDSGIDKMNKQTDPNKSYDALGLIGKAVSGDSSKISRSDKKAQHEITFSLPGPAKSVELSVQNAAGQEVKKLISNDLKAGANRVAWDGMIDNGTPAPEGEYNVVIVAKNGAGQKLAAETRFEGRVTGVKFTPEGPVLMAGKQSIKMKDVKAIFEPEMIKDPSQLVAAKAVAGKDAKDLASNAVGMAGNLENVGMAQGLINQLNSDAAKKEMK